MNTVIINKLKELKPILNEKFGIEEFAVKNRLKILNSYEGEK